MSALELVARIEVIGGQAPLDRILAFVVDFAAREGLDPESAFALQVCVEELATNVFAHGAGPGRQPNLVVQLERSGGVLRARIEDDCPPYNPLEREEVDVRAPIEQRSVGGLGIHLVKQLMHVVAYEYVGARNRVLLERLMPGASSPAGAQSRFNLDIDESESPAARVVRLRGRVDGTVAPLLERRFAEILARGSQVVVLDVGALEYVSSAGLAVLVSLARALRGRGGRLAVAGARSPVRRLFELAGFGAFAGLHEDVPTALRG